MGKSKQDNEFSGYNLVKDNKNFDKVADIDDINFTRDVFIAYHLDANGNCSKESYDEALKLKTVLESSGFSCFLKDRDDKRTKISDTQYIAGGCDCFILVVNKGILDKCEEILRGGGKKIRSITQKSSPWLYAEIKGFLETYDGNVEQGSVHMHTYCYDKDLSDLVIQKLHSAFREKQSLRSFEDVFNWLNVEKLHFEKLKYEIAEQEKLSFATSNSNINTEEFDLKSKKVYKNLYDIGLQYFQNWTEESKNKAFAIFNCLANLGIPEAQFRLGLCYRSGRGVERSYVKAFEWYTKSAEQGYPEAQCSLGNCYYFGRGVDINYTKATEWYTKAANQGHAYAQYNLGDCYFNGVGVEKNYANSLKYFSMSSEQGIAGAQNNLGHHYCEGIGVEQNYFKAVELFSRAAEQGLDVAQYNMGECYELGHGVKQDYKLAYDWYKKAKDQGLNAAKEALERVAKELGKL